ncbi:LexA family protein [Photobacterium leiognathi]|uniref:LexA family protein n=1 Tax=Photobacterium leiognathi TaxID=553611 RepID=UPI002982ABD9|nr:S24 family peptidase [Photobacterium leiognathi]
MPFAPPTHGYEEDHISHTIHEHLFPNNCCYAVTAPNALEDAGIAENDVIVVDKSRSFKHGNVALIRIESESYVVRLYKSKNIWYAVNDERKGKMTEDVCVLGVVTNVVKDQLA